MVQWTGDKVERAGAAVWKLIDQDLQRDGPTESAGRSLVLLGGFVAAATWKEAGKLEHTPLTVILPFLAKDDRMLLNSRSQPVNA